MKHKNGILFNLLVMLSMLLGMMTTPVLAATSAGTQAQPEAALLKQAQGGLLKAAAQEAPVSPSCALLDDPAKRGLMSGMFESALLRACGRTSELPSGEAAGESSRAPAGTDVLVNDPTTDTTASTTQSETSIAINANTATVCSAYNDSGAYNSLGTFTGFSRSIDGGTTFTDLGAVGGTPGAGAFGDPGLIWRQADAAFYLTTLSDAGGLSLYKSADDCQTFTFVTNPSNTGNDDKELIAVDNTLSSPFYGNMYIAWTDFTDGRITVKTSTNGGTTWSSAVKVSAAGVSAQGAWPAVAPNGDVYVAWVRWNPYPSGPIDIEVVRSTNGGSSFTPVTNPMTGKVNPYDNTATANCGRPALKGDIRYLPSPQIAVGPDGALHIIYTYDPDGNGVGDVVNVYYRKSFDNGATWGPELMLNDDGTTTDQWFPTISVGASNVVVATWYDRRLDTANNYLFDYYSAVSYNGGNSFGTNTRVSDVSSPVAVNFDPIIAFCYHGDYDTQIQDSAFNYIQWSDDRNIQNGRNDPDVWFDKAPVLTEIGTLTGVVLDAGTSAPIAGAQIFADGTYDFYGYSAADGTYSMIVGAGTYDVTASAFGYIPQTVNGVVVVDGGTTTQNFSLTAAPSALVSGMVYDINTGWPLYARIDIAGVPGGPFWTDPTTGEYEVSLPTGATYNFTVAAWVPGYLPASVAVPVSGPTTQDFPLDADVANCNAPGYSYSGGTVEDFSSGALPAGWSIVNNGSTCDWRFNNPAGRTNLTGGSDGFAIADSDYCGPSTYMDTELRTPVLNFSTQSSVLLEFKSDYNNLGDTAAVDVSNDGGTSWTNVWSRTTSERGPVTVFLDVSAQAGNQANVQARFHYYNANWAWWWQVDDVKIGATCNPPANGGLVVGNVYDENTSNALNDSNVWNDNGFSAVSRATPEDPNLDDGFFTVFSPASLGGANHYATKSGGYGVDQRTVPVPDGGTVGQDFFLPAGWINNDPASLSATLDFGDVETQQITLTNLGALAATFEINEKDGGFVPAAGGNIHWLKRSKYGTVMGVNRQGKGDVTALAYPKALRWTPNAPAAMNVLVYADDYIHFAPFTYIDQALQYLGVPYTAHYDGDFAGFETDLTSGGPWDLVIFANENFFSPATLDAALNNYVLGGGKLVFQTWAMANFPNLQFTLGLSSFSLNFDPPAPVYWWEPGHPIFSNPESVPEYTSLNGGIYGTYGQFTEPLAGFAALAGYTTPGPDPNQAAMILNGDNTTVFKGFVDGSNSADLDGDSMADPMELWINLISGIEVGFSADVPWLSESPISGTLSGNFLPTLEYKAGDTSAGSAAAAQEAVGAEAPASSEASAMGQASQPYAPTAVLYDNGPLVTNPGSGFGGADLSMLQNVSLGMTINGYGVQYSVGNRLADDFTVTDPAGWLIDKISFFNYQSGSTTASTFTGVYLQIWDGPPDNPASSVVWGDLTTNRLVNTTWSGIYRAAESTPLSSSRPVMANTVKIGAALPPGTYWLDWTVDGTSLLSGPWAPPVTVLGSTGSGNALQWTGAWAAVTDIGPQDFPFVVEGSPYEPQMVVDVTFDAGVPEVGQPGEYLATLNITNDTPYGKLSVPVSMIVNAPDTWGKLEGTVQSLGYCDANPTLVEGAEVVITTATGVTYTLTTDANGYYSRWFPASASPFSITVTAPEHTQGTASGVVLVGGGTTTENFDLRWLEPCVSVDPTSYNVDVTAGYTQSRDLTLYNDGAEATAFKLSEKDGGMLPPLKLVGAEFSAPAAVGPLSVRSPEGRAALEARGGIQAPFAWGAGAPMAVPVVRYASAQCADDPDVFYVVSGVDSTFSITNAAYKYDAAADTWIPLATFPTAQEGPTATCFEGRLYVVGGGGTNQFYIYDIASNLWGSGAALPRPVWGAAVGASDGFVYMAGGDSDFNFGGTSNEVDIYDIAGDTWVGTGTNMPAATGTAGVTQAGSYLYVVGGWNDSSPAANSDVTQRYDMSSDTWETGPTFTSARSDLALAATETYLYAMGGDANGGGPFDMTNTVETLDHTAWPGGSWTDLGDPLPVSLTANNGGFCTEAYAGGEVWTAGGVDGTFTVSSGNYYRPSEGCFKVVSDVPWLSESPITGTVAADSTFDIAVTFDSMTYTIGTQLMATLKVKTDDPYNGLVSIPVTMTIVAPAYGVEASLVDDSLSGMPGETITYTLMVTNTSNGPADTFDVAVGGETWTTTVPAVVGPLDPGESAMVDVSVAIPVSASGGDQDVATCTVTSQGDPTQSAQATMTTTASAEFGVEVSADMAQSGGAGDTVTYMVTVTNTGNSAETFDLSVGGNTWTTTVPATVGPLDPGESATLAVTVDVPAGALVGEQDVATVTVASQGDPTVFADVMLTTTVVSRGVFLPLVMNGYLVP